MHSYRYVVSTYYVFITQYTLKFSLMFVFYMQFNLFLVPTNQSKKAFKKSPKKLAATTLPTLEEVPPEALLCSPPKKPAAKTQPKTDEVLSEAILSSPTVSSTTKELVNLNESQDPDILDGISEENGNLSKIEALELRQKQMEGDNKRKRQLLLQEIADRYYNNPLILFL